MDKKIYIIATGMNGYETMTKKAIDTVLDCDVLIGAKRMVALFSDLKKPSFISYLPNEIYELISECTYHKIAVLMSGDCGFYSGTEKLMDLLDGYDVEIQCGISSPIYFCARLKMKWSDMKFISLHGKKGNVIRNICQHEKTFFLLGGELKAENICQQLCDYHMENLKVYIGENLAMSNERILCDVAENLTDIKTDKLSVMIVENPYYEKYQKSCISDSDFIRDKVPMTKSEIRGICVSKLEIEKDSICWDIGCGTGSVSVEMAMQCYEGTVYSVDKKELALELTDKNRHKFKCDNIEMLLGDAENIVDTLPCPHCVFVGGSCGKLEKILSVAYNKNSNVRIIVTAVSLETLHKSLAVFSNLKMKTEVIQVAVTRTEQIGQHTMLKAENPVFIIKGVSV